MFPGGVARTHVGEHVLLATALVLRESVTALHRVPSFNQSLSLYLQTHRHTNVLTHYPTYTTFCNPAPSRYND